MNEIEYKIQILIEELSFEQLTPAEREMVYSVMTEDEYDGRREVILRSQELFIQEKPLITPDTQILKNLKERIHEPEVPEAVSASPKPFLWWTSKVAAIKNAAAMLLLLLGSYLLFSSSKTNIKYLEKEVVVEKEIRDTVFQERIIEKIVEVPVEKIVKVVKYINEPINKKRVESDVSFAVQESLKGSAIQSVELKDLNKSYGNTKIDESELEQFRVSL